MLYALMFLNVALAVGLMLTLWRSETFRNSWVAHVVTLVVVVVLCVALALVSHRAQLGHPIRIGHAARMLLVGFLYLPFVGFLLVTYVKVAFQTLERPDDAEAAVHARADHYVQSGQYHKAVRALRGELLRNSEDVDARLKLAEVLCELGDCEEAVRVYRVAISQLSDDHERQIQIVFRTAEVLAEMLGEFTEAAKELDYIRKRFPETPNAQVAQKRIVNYMTRAD